MLNNFQLTTFIRVNITNTNTVSAVLKSWQVILSLMAITTLATTSPINQTKMFCFAKI